MGEGKRFLLSLTIFSLVAGGVLGIDHYVGPIEEPEGYKILDYSAALYPNGTLEEVYTYLVKNDGEFHVLYRSWGSEVRFARGEGERVIPIDVNVTPSEGCIGYACSSLGQLETYHGKDLTIYSSDYVKRNEMGIYCREGLRKGIYVVRYTVKIYPELQKGSDGYLLHITFSEDGSAYERVAIRLTGFDVEDVWVPSYMEAAGEENLTIRTKERIDGPITAAILLKSIPEDFTRSGLAEVKSASREGRWSIRKVNLLYMFSLGTYTVVKYYYILFPVFFLALYLLLGREKYPGRVESERILPPRRRPPWIVSYIFGGYGGKKICSEGLLATLLDMKRKGLIRIEGGKIYVLSDYTTDPFERRVLDFLRRHSGKDGLELTKIKGALTTGADAELKEDLLRLLKADGEILEYKEEFLEDYVPWAQYSYIVPSPTILMILFILVFFMSSFRGYIESALVYSALGLFPLLTDNPIRRSFVTRWKNDYYREKLQWDAFRKTVKEKKIDPETVEDLLVEDWIIYGTALGVGNEAYDKLLTYSGSAGVLLLGYPSLSGTFSTLPSLKYISGGAPGGGGVAGGGFGGGVAGAR